MFPCQGWSQTLRQEETCWCFVHKAALLNCALLSICQRPAYHGWPAATVNLFPSFCICLSLGGNPRFHSFPPWQEVGDDPTQVGPCSAGTFSPFPRAPPGLQRVHSTHPQFPSSSSRPGRHHRTKPGKAKALCCILVLFHPQFPFKECSSSVSADNNRRVKLYRCYKK